MNNKDFKTTIAPMGLSLLLGCALTTDAGAAQLTGCVAKSTGNFRIPANGKCKRSETKMVLNTEGPQGPMGLNGPPGLQGLPGPAGAPGTGGNGGTASLGAILEDAASNEQALEGHFVATLGEVKTCSANPQRMDADGKPIEAPCADSVATCPDGKILSPVGKTTCDDIEASEADKAAITARGGSIFVSTDRDKERVGNARLANRSRCRIETYTGRDFGAYTPWCFFRISPATITVPDPDYQGGQEFARPLSYYNIYKFQGVDMIEIYDQDYVWVGDTTLEITQNPANYECFPVRYQAKAACVTEPAKAIDKIKALLGP